ncbi:prefoldin subunit 2 [Aplysia californica]|uniref:Prefoldin subunit 2 n=1 Tax=Aplysia californica TaxID=6500 RepID=A0ABM0JMR9_APLCA|nr:prefoldin subunit 2 [Aplysia californica]
MATSLSSFNNSAKTKGAPTPEQAAAAFNELRQQQRLLASRISEVEMDMKEHDLVIEVLKGVDPNRKCYRMIGGILVERTVDVVLPGLATSRDKMKEYTDSLRGNLETKGKELVAFREKYNIKIRTDDPKDEKEEPSAKSGERQANILASV